MCYMEVKIAVRVFLALEKVSFYIFFSLVYISIKNESFFWRGHPTENESFFWRGHPTENEYHSSGGVIPLKMNLISWPFLAEMYMSL